MNNFGFWLLPPKEIQALYQPIIDHWSRKLKTPNFEPHITILDIVQGEKDKISQGVEIVANSLKPIPILFSEVSVSTTYFQCVFARVKPTLALLNAHTKLKSRLNYPENYLYMPHMSLVYGDIDLAKRFKIAQAIKLPVNNFKADRICVVEVDSLNPKTWLHIAEFDLKTKF